MNKLTIEEMYKLAHNRRGKCLSNRYINRGSKLLWECEYKHQWKSTPKCIKSGSWCPKCAHIIIGLKNKLIINKKKLIKINTTNL